MKTKQKTKKREIAPETAPDIAPGIAPEIAEDEPVETESGSIEDEIAGNSEQVDDDRSQAA